MPFRGYNRDIREQSNYRGDSIAVACRRLTAELGEQFAVVVIQALLNKPFTRSLRSVRTLRCAPLQQFLQQFAVRVVHAAASANGLRFAQPNVSRSDHVDHCFPSLLRQRIVSIKNGRNL
jgi:hypothetical protein